MVWASIDDRYVYQSISWNYSSKSKTFFTDAAVVKHKLIIPNMEISNGGNDGTISNGGDGGDSDKERGGGTLQKLKIRIYYWK